MPGVVSLPSVENVKGVAKILTAKSPPTYILLSIGLGERSALSGTKFVLFCFVFVLFFVFVFFVLFFTLRRAIQCVAGIKWGICPAPCNCSEPAQLARGGASGGHLGQTTQQKCCGSTGGINRCGVLGGSYGNWVSRIICHRACSRNGTMGWGEVIFLWSRMELQD